MEQFPLAEYGFHSAEALHVMIEAKKLAYADMLRYVADPRFGDTPLPAMLSKDYATGARPADRSAIARRATVEPSVFDGLTTAPGGDTIYLSVVDQDGNIVSLIQSIYHVVRQRGSCRRAPASRCTTAARCSRSTNGIPTAWRRASGRCTRSSRRSWRRATSKIGFGIMGGFNQAQAHAQFVADIVDFGLDIQQALEAGRFTKATFDGATSHVEALVPESTRRELTALGHDVDDRAAANRHVRIRDRR